MLCAAYTGLRAGELWALQAQDIATTNGQPQLHVRRTLTTENGALTFRPTTKTGQPRMVSLPAFLARQLQAHTRQLHPADLVFAAPGGGGARKKGERTPSATSSGCAACSSPPRQAALPAGEAAPALARPARHVRVPADRQRRQHHARQRAPGPRQSTRMTLDRYAHLYPSEEAAMATKLDAVWNEQPAAWRARPRRPPPRTWRPAGPGEPTSLSPG